MPILAAIHHQGQHSIGEDFMTGSVDSKTRQEYITFKEYVDARLDALEKAADLSHRAMQDKLSAMNEFRETLRDQAAKFVTRNEMEAALDKIDTDIRSLRESRAHLEGKASATSVYIAYAISLIGIIIGLISLLSK